MTALPVPVAPLRLVAGLALSAAAADAAAVDPQTLIRRWLDAKSPSARRTYGRALQRFAAWAIDGAAKPEDAMRLLVGADAGAAHSMAEGWRDELLAAGLAPGSVAALVTGLCSLVRCCRRAGLVSWSLENVAPRAERRQDRSGPRRGDVERLLATIDDKAEQGHRRAVRDSALVRLLYCAGLRRSEATQLRLEDVDLAVPCVKPRRKGHRERSAVTVSTGAAAALQRWLAVRGDAPGFLFFGTKGTGPETALSGEQVRRLLRSWAKRAGIRATIRPHGMRHSGASEIAARGSLASLMAYGGWSSMTAASRYLDKRAEERAAALALVDL